MSESILREIASGSSTAMQECIDRYGSLVWSLARRAAPTPQDAEDAVQDIFTDLWKSAGRYDPEVASESTFVAMVARRRLIDRYRQYKRQPQTESLGEPDQILESGDPDTAQAAETRDEARRVSEALATLRHEHKEVLELTLLHGQTHQQIADGKKMPLGTVKSHARRGLMRLRELLGVENAPAGNGQGGSR